MKSINFFCVSFVILCLSGEVTFSQTNFQILESTLSGTGFSSGGTLTLTGAIGRHSSETLRGGEFALATGVWVVSLPTVRIAKPVLKVIRSDNYIIISWPLSGNRIVVEETRSLSGPGTWAVSPETPTVIGGELRLSLPLIGETKFYRLIVEGE